MSMSKPEVAAWLRNNVWRVAKTAALLAVIVELGGIWHDLHHIRDEQVKNAFYGLPDSRQATVRQNAFAKRRLQSTTNVSGDVEIDGEVDVAQPIDVEIER